MISSAIFDTFLDHFLTEIFLVMVVNTLTENRQRSIGLGARALEIEDDV